MDRKLSIVPRLRRFRRNLAASLDEEGERLSTAVSRTGRTLHRLGRSVASSLDTSDDYLEDDPVGAFLEKERSDFDSDPGEAAETPGLIDILEPGTDAAVQDSVAASPEPDAQQAKGSTEAPQESPEPIHKSEFDSTDSGIADEPLATSQPQDSDLSPQADPESAPEPVFDSFDSAITGSSQAEISPQEPADVPQLDEAAAEPLLDDEQSEPPLSQDTVTEIPTVASFETLSPETDAQSLDIPTPPPIESLSQSQAAPAPPAEFGEEAPMDSKQEASVLPQNEEVGMTVMTNNEPLDLDGDENIAQESLPAEEGSQTGDRSDSLLDIFRSEEVEENPIAELAKGLPDVDINHLLEKIKQFASELKGGA